MEKISTEKCGNVQSSKKVPIVNKWETEFNL